MKLHSLMVCLLVGGSISIVTARDYRVASTDEDYLKILTGLFLKPGRSFILPNSIIDTQFLHTLEEFSVKLYKEVRKDHSENVLVSALSANLALGMIAYGAKGNTKSEILHMLDLQENDDALKSNYESLYNNLTSTSGPELKILNKLFFADYLNVKRTFTDVVVRNFHGKEERMDFEDSTRAATEINRWVSRATNSRINEIITSDNLDKDTAMIGVNVIYFKGEWKNQFTDVANMDFRTDSGEIKTVKMMYENMEIDYGYLSEIGARFVELPYQGDELKMIIVLPDMGVSLQEVEIRLEMRTLRDLRMKRSETSVDMYLPKFTVESTIDLKNIVKKLGMNEVFTNRANLSGIAGNHLELSEIKQKVFIEVNEKGTEAAAVSSVEIGYKMGRDVEVFYANRPFHYKIIKTVGENDGIVLFAGNYKNVY